MVPRSRTFALWAVAVLLPTASPALARVRPGIELGMNVSTLDYYEELPWWNNGWRPSFTGGVVVEFPFGDRVALTTGLRYAQQGNRVEVNLTGPPALVGEFRIMQNYLAVPVRFEVHPFPATGFFLAVGPEVGFLLSGRAVSEYTSSGVPFKETQDIGNILEEVNVAIDVGAGYSFPFVGHLGIVEARYSQGITSAAKKDRWFSDWKNKGVEFLAGIRW